MKTVDSKWVFKVIGNENGKSIVSRPDYAQEDFSNER